MSNSIIEIATCDDRTIKVAGAVSCGKTQSLINRCVVLLEKGVSPDQILVTTATSFAAQAFRKRLAASLPANDAALAQHVTVCTALQAIMATLALPEARSFTGRTGRLMSDFEYNFLLEDMKTLGQSRRELRSMLRYFYRNWANLTPEEEWYYGDTISVCGKLQGMCALLGAISKYEAPYLCANFLLSDEGEPFRGAYEYVFCDDYQNLSRAEQTALCLHAKAQLIVAGNQGQLGTTGSDFPHVEGFQKFEALRRNVTVFTLDRPFGNGTIQKMAQALAAEDGVQASSFAAGDACVQRIKWTDPQDELMGITKVLRDQFNKDKSLNERDVCFLAPNKRFARMYQKALDARGFKTSLSGFGSGFGGDPRMAKTCPALVAYVKLNLIARPHDAMAWRAWCGFDDALCNSQSFDGLYAYAGKHDRGVMECLEEVSANILAGSADPFLRAGVLAKRYQEGMQIIEGNAARRGFNLLKAVGASGLAEFKELEGTIIGSESANELFALAERSVFSPALCEHPGTINIVSYANMPGISFDNIIAVALVDGYMPKRDAFEVVSTPEDRQAIMDSQRRALYGALGKARKSLILSYFTKCDLELAERTKMQVSRIRSEEGQRIAMSRPSCFFTEMEQECPRTISGQTYLAQRNLN